jgi:ribosomal protein L29
MNLKELRSKTIEELNELLKEANKTIGETKMSILKNKEKNVKKVLFLRKDIARLSTLIREKVTVRKG